MNQTKSFFKAKIELIFCGLLFSIRIKPNRVLDSVCLYILVQHVLYEIGNPKDTLRFLLDTMASFGTNIECMNSKMGKLLKVVAFSFKKAKAK